MENDPQPSFSTRRQWGIRLNVAVSIVALAAILVMINWLAARFPARWEVNGHAAQELTPVTLRVLQGITNEVKIFALFSHENDLYDPVVRLLRQYELRSPHLKFEAVNYLRDPQRASQVLRDLERDPGEGGDRVLFSSGGRVKVVRDSELSEYEGAMDAMVNQREVKRTGFQGEQLFTSALYSVTDPQSVKAYLLLGHGEHDPDDLGSQLAYGRFIGILQDSNVEVGALTLSNNKVVPKDCRLLVIAGPRNAIPLSELQEIDAYLKRGGRLLVLFRQESLNVENGEERSGLDRLLWTWGVAVGPNQIADHVSGASTSLEQVLVMNYGSHEVVHPLARARVRVTLSRPRSITTNGLAGAGVAAPQVTELLQTSPRPQVTLLNENRGNPQVLADRPISLAVAVEKGGLKGIPDQGIPRLVVVGDSNGFGNALIQEEANRDFARNVVNWLLSREIWISEIGPRPMNEYRLSLSGRELSLLRWTLLAGIPGSVLVLGWFVWVRRRS